MNNSRLTIDINKISYILEILISKKVTNYNALTNQKSYYSRFFGYKSYMSKLHEYVNNHINKKKPIFIQNSIKNLLLIKNKHINYIVQNILNPHTKNNINTKKKNNIYGKNKNSSEINPNTYSVSEIPIESTTCEINSINKINNIEQLKKCYRKLVLKHHPNKGGKTENFQLLQSKYENRLTQLSNRNGIQ